MNRFFDLLNLVLFLGYAAILLWFSLVPHPQIMIPDFLSWDKLQHALSYALLTLLAGWAFRWFAPSPRAWGLAAVFAVLYGAILEGAQALFTKGRQAEFGDLVADALGAALIFGIFWWRFHGHRKGSA